MKMFFGFFFVVVVVVVVFIAGFSVLSTLACMLEYVMQTTVQFC